MPLESAQESFLTSLPKYKAKTKKAQPPNIQIAEARNLASPPNFRINP